MPERTSAPAAIAGTIDVGGDLTVNRLGFGAMRITGPGIWGPPADRDEAKAVLRRAVELGVNFIDTADSYGPERQRGAHRRGAPPVPGRSGHRHQGRPGAHRPGQWPVNGRPEHLIEACEGSLRRLELDQIPLYQFHRPDPAVPLEDSIGALVDAQGAGQDPAHRRCPTSPRTSCAAPSDSPRSCRSRTATTSTTAGRSRWSTCASRSRWCSCRGRRSRTSTATAAVREIAAAPRRDAAPDRAGLAAGPLAVDAAHPRHRLGGAPGGQRRRGGDHADRGRGRRRDPLRRLTHPTAGPRCAGEPLARRRSRRPPPPCRPYSPTPPDRCRARRPGAGSCPASARAIRRTPIHQLSPGGACGERSRQGDDRPDSWVLRLLLVRVGSGRTPGSVAVAAGRGCGTEPRRGRARRGVRMAELVSRLGAQRTRRHAALRHHRRRGVRHRRDGSRRDRSVGASGVPSLHWSAWW